YLWVRQSFALGPHKGLSHAVTARKIAVVVGIDPETMEQVSPVTLRIGMSERHVSLSSRRTFPLERIVRCCNVPLPIIKASQIDSGLKSLITIYPSRIPRLQSLQVA